MSRGIALVQGRLGMPLLPLARDPSRDGQKEGHSRVAVSGHWELRWGLPSLQLCRRSRGPAHERLAETLPYLPAHSHVADPGILGNLERGGERGFQKVCVMSPPTPTTQLSASTLQVSWGLGDVGRRL